MGDQWDSSFFLAITLSKLIPQDWFLSFLYLSVFKGIENNNMIQPSTMTIHSIYPNPTNTSFTILFSTSKINAPSQISINDLLGREIYTTSIYENNNQFKWTWDGLDNNGIIAPTGTYLVSIFHGNQLETRKVTILKWLHQLDVYFTW